MPQAPGAPGAGMHKSAACSPRRFFSIDDDDGSDKWELL